MELIYEYTHTEHFIAWECWPDVNSYTALEGWYLEYIHTDPFPNGIWRIEDYNGHTSELPVLHWQFVYAGVSPATTAK